MGRNCISGGSQEGFPLLAVVFGHSTLLAVVFGLQHRPIFRLGRGFMWRQSEDCTKSQPQDYDQHGFFYLCAAKKTGMNGKNSLFLILANL